MDGAARKRIRDRLQSRREELLREGPSRAEPTRAAVTDVGHDEDAQPLAEMSQAIASARNRARAEELKRIDAALARLGLEDFGICTACEEPIAPKRLEAMPWVELCTACQARRDAPRGGTRRHAGDFVD